MQSDVFQFFFEAAAGISLSVLVFGVLPYQLCRKIWRKISEWRASRV